MITEPEPPRVSLCMIALNEERYIKDCLRSALGIADEIVLGVDSRTTDETAAIARKHGARVFTFDWRDDFAYARNLTLEAARGAYILVLDSDDRLLPAGKRAIRDALTRQWIDPKGKTITGCSFEILEQDLSGQELERWAPAPRFFRCSGSIRYHGIVHEDVLDQGRYDRTSFVRLEGGPHIVHVGYDPQLRKERGKTQRNERLLKLRLVKDPNDLIAHRYLAVQYFRLGDLDAARRHARSALQGPRARLPERFRPELEAIRA